MARGPRGGFLVHGSCVWCAIGVSVHRFSRWDCGRSWRRTGSGLLCLAWLSGTSVSARASLPPNVQLAWSAPAECPTLEQASATLSSLVSADGLATSDEPRLASVAI